MVMLFSFLSSSNLNSDGRHVVAKDESQNQIGNDLVFTSSLASLSHFERLLPLKVTIRPSSRINTI